MPLLKDFLHSAAYDSIRVGGALGLERSPSINVDSAPFADTGRTFMMMESEPRASVAAIVVLYHPNLEVLSVLYESVRRQVHTVFFVDNTPDSAGAKFAPAAEAWEVRYLPLGENLGIAEAQNVGIEKALADGCSHVLLLDQDSRLKPTTVIGLLEAEEKLLAQGRSLAAVGPVFIDTKTHLPGKIHRHGWFRLSKPFVDLKEREPIETDWLIASGCLIQAGVLRQVGPMRAELFIDAVDTEWGLRARSLGLLSFVVPTVHIDHSVGDSYIKLLGVSVIMHSELRNYYIARNWLYLLRVTSMGRYWRSGVLLRLSKFLLVHYWFTDNRLSMIRMFTRALIDGVRGQLGPYAAERKNRVR